jgi:hypothetical protein
MSATSGLALDALDRGAVLVRRLPGWVGVLWLSALPCRFLTVVLLAEIWRLGGTIRAHGDALTSLAELILASWLVAQIGRQFFVRACRIVHDSGNPSLAAVVRLPWRELLAGLYAGLVLEVLFWLLLPLWFFSPLILLLNLSTPALAPPGGLNLLGPLLGYAQLQLGAVLRLGLMLLVASLIVFINVMVAVKGAVWLLSGVAGLDLSHWLPLLSLDNHLYLLLLCAGTLLLVEPFALSAMTVLAILSRARRSGDDLREWFELLRAESRP